MQKNYQAQAHRNRPLTEITKGKRLTNAVTNAYSVVR